MRRIIFILFVVLASAAFGDYQGDLAEDSTLTFKWSTFDSTGASSSRTTTGTIRVYKDDNLTQTSVGVTDVVDFDSMTGQNACTIDTSADAFYVTGSDYSVFVVGAVVDSVTMTAVIAEFSIQNRYERGTDSAALAATALTNATWTDARAGYLDELAAANMPTDIADIPTVAEFNARTLAAADYFLFGSDTVANVNTVATLTGHTAQTGDSYTRIGAPAGASVSADVAAIKAETATIVADTGELQTNQGAWATAIGFSTHTAADVWAVVARTLTSGAAPSAGDVADAVWDEANADHLVAGSTGAKLNSAAAAGDPLSSAVPAAYASGTAGYAIGTYLDAKISNISIAGTGTETYTHTLTSDAPGRAPIVGATVWVSSDSAGATVLASGMTNSSGKVTFFLNSGTVYIWRNKTGFSFMNPYTEVIP